MYPLLLFAGAVALAFYIREKIRAYSVTALLLKALVSALFIAVGVYGAWRSALAGKLPPLSPFVLLGLLCGLLGDVWLDLKYVFPKHDRSLTLMGFTVFGIGHVMYVAGLLSQYGTGRFLALSFILAAVAAALVGLMEKPMKLVYGSMKPIVIIYGFLLFSTVFVSGGLMLSYGGTALKLFFTGAVSFAISDLILSGTYFGGKERKVDIISNYVFYYAGQFLIAYSLSFI